MKIRKLSDLKGKVFTKVYRDGERIVFENGKTQFILEHLQDCCEDVTIDDICGNLTDLENAPIVVAEETTNVTDLPKNKYDDSFTWTFYKLATEKGWVDIRFYGTSNGYYSETVDLCEYNNGF